MTTRSATAAPPAIRSERALALFLAPALVLVAGVSTATAQEPPLPPASGPEAIVGTWEGDIELPGGTSLRMVFHVEADGAGGISATADSPDQGVTGIPIEEATFEGGELTLEIRSIGASFTGSRLPDEVLDGSWNQGGQSFPLRLRRVDEVTRPERPQEPEPPLPYREEEVRYPNAEAGIELAGTLTLPEGEGPFPAVVLISGSGPQNRDSEVFGHRPFLVLSDHLTRRGIAVLRSDDRGVGESEGEFATATTRDFAGDAVAAVGYLRTRPEIDADGVGLVGMSEGGLVAPMAATGSDSVSFIVLLAGPGIPGDELLHLQSARIARAGGVPDEMIEWNRRLQQGLFEIVKDEPEETRRKERLEVFLRETLDGMSEAERQGTGITRDAEEGWIGAQLEAVGGPWFRFFLLHDPAGVLREVRVPVLALNGELDLQVPPDENLQAVEAALDEAGNPDVTTMEMPGLNHLFQEADTGSPAEYARIEQTMSPQVMERVADWILERAGDRR